MMLQIAVCEDEKAMGSYLKQLIDKRLAGRKEYQIEVQAPERISPR